ncbi:FAD-dependent oxidoreductase [Burkholderia latens]|uniref:Epoxidase LasC n=1 Tax=Burkholderia latens TaxID=488446 RepID=A0A6H9T6P0_9BURK|nr:hypothetical protein [Burkholderia latens]KAB0644781.1 hypothetical protein F7R21_00190 [Burkholderia latens]VWB17656.1 Putative epoxidase LasC [Burkholderia latens]
MHTGKCAVIVGASIAGLSAAQALVGQFERIVIIERDEFPVQAEARAGVPQGLHAHSLLPGGLTALNALFGDFDTLLREGGAKVTDWGQLKYEFPGQPALPLRNFNMPFFMCSRPFVEHVIRRRVESQRGVVILAGRRVKEFIAAPNGDSVVGVKCVTRDGADEVHEAALVIDASGRGELTLDFLRATGRPMPDESTVGIDYHAFSVIVEAPERFRREAVPLLTMPDRKHGSRLGCLLAREDDYIFAYLGVRGEAVLPDDWPGFVDLAGKLSTGTMHAVLRHATPRGRVRHYLFPESRRRHFERIENWPRGLIPFGDVICRVNPVYAQGMTTAFKEAVILRDLLDSRRYFSQPIDGLAQALLSAAGPLLDNVWTLSAVPDLAHPGTRGERTDDLAEILAYSDAVHRAAFVDTGVHELLFRVLGLVEPAAKLYSSDIVARVRDVAAQAM